MDAVAALDEIAFWLERELAPTFRVQAFRKAAAIIRGIAPDELAQRVEDGRLKRTKGIGDRTFTVIEQAVSGQVPDYLANLRETSSAPLTDGAGKLGAALRGDLHAHTDWSDGGSPIELMAAAAHMLGREYLAITDHSPTLTVASGLSAERLRTQLTAVAAADQAAGDDVTLLSGIEVDILEDGSLDQEAELLEQLDVVVASVHSKLRADRTVMTRRMLGAVRTPRTNILGHITGRLIRGSRGTRPPSEFDAKKVFAECAAHNVAVEINARPEREDPPDDLIAIALDAGCLFSIDSDAHAPGQLDFLQYGAERALHAGVPAERIITTWPLERLREWLAER